jgi:hypothetical protein
MIKWIIYPLESMALSPLPFSTGCCSRCHPTLEWRTCITVWYSWARFWHTCLIIFIYILIHVQEQTNSFKRAMLCRVRKTRDGPRRCCRPCYRCWPKPCREIRTRRVPGGAQVGTSWVAGTVVPPGKHGSVGKPWKPMSNWMKKRHLNGKIVDLNGALSIAMFDYQRVNRMPLTYHLGMVEVPRYPTHSWWNWRCYIC